MTKIIVLIRIGDVS